MIEIFDRVILDWFQTIQSPILTPIMKLVTVLGEAGIVWIVIGLILVIRKPTRKAGAIVLLSLLLCVLVGNGVLKNVVARPRPCWRNPQVPLLISMPKDFSFPSGHTMSSFAAATSIFLWDRRWGTAAFVLALIIALSRLYFYVHYPTDILAGIGVGILMALTAKGIVDTIVKKRVKDTTN